MFDFKNLGSMMEQAKQMQENLRRELESLVVEGTSGGGVVKARMNGNKVLLSLQIDREALVDDDFEMLQDLVLSAVNQAGRRVDEELTSRMGTMARGLNLPPGLF